MLQKQFQQCVIIQQHQKLFVSACESSRDIIVKSISKICGYFHDLTLNKLRSLRNKKEQI